MRSFNTASVILGSLITICLILVTQNLFSMLYFYPTNYIIFHKALFAVQLEKLPTQYYLLNIISCVIASFIGGTIPVVIGNAKLGLSLMVGATVTVFGIIHMWIVPVPAWYQIACFMVFIPACYSGGFAIKKIFN